MKNMIGTVAQLVERMFRIYEARGSTPLCSTFYTTPPSYRLFSKSASPSKPALIVYPRNSQILIIY